MMLILVLFIGLQSILFNNAQIAEDLLQKQALGCHLRLYTYRVEQTDSSGRICWDNVSAMSCWGRCDSREIPDWRFPYKCTRHPVCIHGTRSKAVAILRNCEPGADTSARRYEYYSAESCSCHACKSTHEISCEGPAAAHSRPVATEEEVQDQTKARTSGVLTLLSGDGNDYKDDEYTQ